MTTVSHIVEKIVSEQPIIYQAIEQDIVSTSSLASQIKKDIEKALDKPVSDSAIVMALRRYSEKIIKKNHSKNLDFSSEIFLKTNLCHFSIAKSPQLFTKLLKLQENIDLKGGDTLNIIHGNYETSIITNTKNCDIIKDLIEEEKVIEHKKELVSLSVKVSKNFLFTPGVIATIARKLTWQNINIFEMITTLTELMFIVSENDAAKGYDALNKLIQT